MTPVQSSADGGEASAARSVLDAVPDFSAAPLEQGGRARQRAEQYSKARASEAAKEEGSGPNQVLLYARQQMLLCRESSLALAI